ncbi:hypothetical protein D9758_012958 [Tetrapyrgos nigripes]|uniref:Uncharacterized protein n=1 Tax=Tetrapyrgos nigripes TaxID=182062 RepID=A0A8H5CMH2_9AGAR|nr:hypothetical protein D9758_012958 [Tetrapyrgos nigripes]
MADSDPEQSVLTSQDSWDISEAVISETIQGLFYGLECLLMFAAVYKLSRRGLRKSIRRQLLILVIAIMFICSTTTAVCNVVGDVVQLRSMAPALNYDPTMAIQKTQIIAVFTTRISYLLGDLIVVWRAWILFGGEPIFRGVLAACFTMTFVAAIVNLVFTIRNILDFEFKPQPGARLILPATLFFTNMVATSFIAYKTWYYRRSVAKFLNRGSKRGQVENVLILLIESGFLYSFLWILSLISTSNPQYYDFAVFFGTILPHAAGIYPTTIILLTAFQKSCCDTTLQGQVPSLGVHTTKSSDREERGVPTQSLRFAPMQATRTGDEDFRSSSDFGRSASRGRYSRENRMDSEVEMYGIDIVEAGHKRDSVSRGSKHEGIKHEGTEVV